MATQVDEGYQLAGVLTDLFNRPRVTVVKYLQTPHESTHSTVDTHTHNRFTGLRPGLPG